MCTAHASLSIKAKTLLLKASKEHNLPYELLVAVAVVESNGRPNAINHKTHDYGLMQINAKTAQAYGFKPEEMLNKQKSILVAAKLLKTLKKKFGHEPTWACRYNAGWAKNVPNWSVCKQYMAKLQKAGYTNVVVREVAVAD